MEIQKSDQRVAIIGGGPAGLMAAEVISAQKVYVDVYDSMPSVGRKFLMAGKSGLNLTHSEPFDSFVKRYGARQDKIRPILEEFGPNEIRAWAKGLGIETFVGTSGRVFPAGMKASPLLRAWLKRLEANGVKFHLRHKWVDWNPDNSLQFETKDGEKIINPKAVILALGGGSWSRLGSDGAWVKILNHAGVKVETLKPSNCGFEVNWSTHFREKYHGQPLKSVALTFKETRREGEFVVTQYGVEGSLIYAFSAQIREAIERNGSANIQLDLMPHFTQDDVLKKLSRPRGSKSMANHLEKTLGIKGVKAGLLREFLPKDTFQDMSALAGAIKSLSIPLIAPRPLDEAISTAGGISFDELNDELMLKKMPSVFCAGEMLDWDAPTGGYLLTACLASGYQAGKSVLSWIKRSG